MSTIKSVELRERERQSLCMLVQAQWDLIMVRGLQVAAEAEELDIYRSASDKLEAELDQARIDLAEAGDQMIELRARLANVAHHEH
jgi:hypothetical protein